MRLWIVAGAIFLAWTGGSPALWAADPFYEAMLADGRDALERGDLEVAVKKLEIASFGFLDEPPLLAESLVILLMTHDDQGDLAQVRTIFARLDEIEKDFQAVSQARLDPERRQRFEDTVVRRISERALASSSFRALLVTKLEAEIATLPPRRMRLELEARVEEEPENAKWHIRLAALELQEGRNSESLAWSDQAVALGEELPCLRGAALEGLKRDSEAVVELMDCPESGTRLDWTAAALRALSRLDAWDEAAALLDRSDPEILEDRRIERIARKVRRKVSSLDSGDSGDSGDKGKEPDPEGEEASISAIDTDPERSEIEDSEPSTLTADERADLQEARTLLRAARRLEELRAAAALADPVANRHPSSEEAQLVAGEIAYREARWDDASHYFRLAGDPGDSRPALLFYMAVSFFESGEHALARQVLERSLPKLHRSPFVDGYIERIRATK